MRFKGFEPSVNLFFVVPMRIVAFAFHSIVKRDLLLRVKEQAYKKVGSLEALPYKHSNFNYFLCFEKAACGIHIN
jgi:hypothetical protein